MLGKKVYTLVLQGSQLLKQCLEFTTLTMEMAIYYVKTKLSISFVGAKALRTPCALHLDSRPYPCSYWFTDEEKKFDGGNPCSHVPHTSEGEP